MVLSIPAEQKMSGIFTQIAHAIPRIYCREQDSGTYGYNCVGMHGLQTLEQLPPPLPPGGLPAQGVYVLWLWLPERQQVQVGALGWHHFPPGFYAYAGSAQRNLPARLQRHARLVKPLKWHIDYLRPHTRLLGTAAGPAGKSVECMLAKALGGLAGADVPVPGFGASDCKCRSHLVCFSARPPECGAPQLLHPVLRWFPLADMAAQEMGDMTIPNRSER